MAVGLGSFSILSSAEKENPPAFKPTPLEQVVAPRVPDPPALAPPASAPPVPVMPVSVPSPTPKPIESALADPPESHVVSAHDSEAQDVLKAGKPVEISTSPDIFLERHLGEQSFPLMAAELRIGDRSGRRPRILLGYGKLFQDESAFRVFTSHPRREESSCAYFEINLNF